PGPAGLPGRKRLNPGPAQEICLPGPALSLPERHPPRPGSVFPMSSSSKHLHFIGICGTAMGSTAVALRALGYTISGSDQKVYPPMSDVLREAGITVSEGYRPENLPPDADVYVV